MAVADSEKMNTQCLAQQVVPDCSGLTDEHVQRLTAWQRPRDSNGRFIVQPRSQQPTFPSCHRAEPLHVRLYPAIKPFARLFFHVGTGATIADPKWEALHFAPLAELGLAVVSYDPHAHGHSAGEPHGVIGSAEVLVRDFVSLASNYSTGLPEVDELPFFLAGESLGGVVSMLAGLELQAGGSCVNARFAGVIAQSVAVQPTGLPPRPLLRALRRLCCGCCRPDKPLPIKGMSLSALSPHSEDHEFFPFSKTVGAFHPISWTTVFSVSDAVEALRRNISRINFPFLLLHDRHDPICSSKGVERLLRDSATPTGNKQAVMLEGHAAHIVLLAYPGPVLRSILSWSRQTLNSSS
mmetsp:Transcript_13462/g.26438  ORF Transcript_13462/g.26438 Transcript_13462/m.26438 type:complete len:352 (-) Transcript_13462:157-1212(-)